MCRTSQSVLWTALLGVFCVFSPLDAQRTDVPILENGDRITGEVQGLSRGTLSYKTDDAGTMSVRWLHVVSLQSLGVFRLDSPKLDISAGPTFYFGLTEWGRIRGTLSSRVKYELLKDFFLSLNFDASLGTRPLSDTAEKRDCSVSFTVGWSWS